MSLWAQFWSIAQFVPVAKLMLFAALALLAGLALGVMAAWGLHRTGLLRRRTRIGRWVARLYFFYLPVVLAICAMQAALAMCVEGTLAEHLKTARPVIRTLTQQTLGTMQVQLQSLLEQHPQLSTVSIEQVVDVAVDQAVQAPEAMGNSALRQLAAAGAALLGAHAFRETIKDVLVERLQKLAHIDAQTTRIALRQSLASLADGEFVASILTQRIHAFFVTLYRGIGLHCLFWLALAALEIGLAQWRLRRTSTSAELPA